MPVSVGQQALGGHWGGKAGQWPLKVNATRTRPPTLPQVLDPERQDHWQDAPRDLREADLPPQAPDHEASLVACLVRVLGEGLGRVPRQLPQQQASQLAAVLVAGLSGGHN